MLNNTDETWQLALIFIHEDLDNKLGFRFLFIIIFRCNAFWQPRLNVCFTGSVEDIYTFGFCLKANTAVTKWTQRSENVTQCLMNNDYHY